MSRKKFRLDRRPRFLSRDPGAVKHDQSSSQSVRNISAGTGRVCSHRAHQSLEEAVRRLTSQAAIRDRAAYNDPLHYSVGVKDILFVNGRLVLLDGKITDERPGKALRGPGYFTR